MTFRLPYREIWGPDSEFHAPRGGRQVPICWGAKELLSGRTVMQWLYERPPPAPIIPTDASCLLAGFFVSAELGTFQALGWPLPCRIVDLFAEFRCLWNGRRVPLD